MIILIKSSLSRNLVLPDEAESVNGTIKTEDQISIPLSIAATDLNKKPYSLSWVWHMHFQQLKSMC